MYIPSPHAIGSRSLQAASEVKLANQRAGQKEELKRQLAHQKAVHVEAAERALRKQRTEV